MHEQGMRINGHNNNNKLLNALCLIGLKEKEANGHNNNNKLLNALCLIGLKEKEKPKSSLNSVSKYYTDFSYTFN